MSTGDKKGGPPKPFLGDADLSSDLDAWDEMFDNLHAGPEPIAAETQPPPRVTDRSGAGLGPLPMEWPAPAPEPVRAAEPALAVAHEEPDFGPPDIDLDEQMSLDHAVAQPPPGRASSSLAEWQAGPDETDFSDVGAEGEPAALGQMLGGSGEVPAWEDSDDDVYTSASRPNVKASPDDRSLPEDPLAPPPAAPPSRASTPTLRPSSPALVKRTGPAIIRRQTPVSVPAVPRLTQPYGLAPRDSSHDFGESTRIADADELEAKAEESRRADARSKAPTAPPPMSFTPAAYDAPAADDDDEYEIEIGASVEETPIPEPVVSPRRSVAHVIRRVETPPRAVPVVPAQLRDSDPVIEVTQADIPAAPPDAGEDDFSDVAAAVGAASTFDDAAIDDQVPTTMLPEDVEIAPSGDAYVQLEPNLDELDVAVSDDAILAREDVPAGVETPVPQEDVDVELPRAPASSGDRPPALMDLYPRVKRPTSVPMMMPATPSRAVRAATTLADQSPEIEPVIDLEAIGAESSWPEQVPPMPTSQLDEDGAAMLLVYEREIPTVDEPTAAAALRIEAGRLCERLGDSDRARTHYDAALLADPRATAALRGLRRLARAQGDLVEATRHLDAEISVAGALERRPLSHYRVDMLMASGEHDLARVAVGELLDTAPSDVRALLAQLELAFLDGRADEFGNALEQLAHAVTDNQLRAAVQQARALL
ncbi:MAG TPA: tetratricopeptide repeat protein, partial [Kofleriaceae bacterium]|nr:tetratricopeptide repeat protein [Kofleriaceae bacterium]